MADIGNAIKIRLIQLGRSQRDLADALEEIGIKANAAQISNAINRPDYPKQIMIRGAINDIIRKWETESKAAR